jgi:hypothetical protein
VEVGLGWGEELGAKNWVGAELASKVAVRVGKGIAVGDGGKLLLAGSEGVKLFLVEKIEHPAANRVNRITPLLSTFGRRCWLNIRLPSFHHPVPTRDSR